MGIVLLLSSFYEVSEERKLLPSLHTRNGTSSKHETRHGHSKQLDLLDKINQQDAVFKAHMVWNVIWIDTKIKQGGNQSTGNIKGESACPWT